LFTQSIRHAWRLTAITIAMFVVRSNPGLAQAPADVTAAQVDEAIAGGVRFLKLEQRDDGTWEERALYAGGLTPLALLQSGCDVKDEAVAPPQLESIKIDDRHAIIFPPYDLSCALEGPAPQCEGYARKDAARISLNVLLYAIH
jgi:hypothetical protein